VFGRSHALAIGSLRFALSRKMYNVSMQFGGAGCSFHLG
jgi:hypothetical protein